MPTLPVFPVLVTLILAVLSGTAGATERAVPALPGALIQAIAGAAPGDVLTLAPGLHQGPVILDRPVTLDGQGQAVIDGGGTGSVITITGQDITVRNLEIKGSGSAGENIDAAVQMTRSASRVLIEGNRLVENLHGVDVHGARDSIVRNNVIIGRQDRHMNSRGNGVYVWNAPGTVVENNDIRYGRDGIFVNTSQKGIFRGNLFRDLRFAVHYMYADNSEISGNVSIGNHMGYALMFSNRITVTDNFSLGDRDYGLMLNYANNADVRGNLVRGGAEKCAFIYNAHHNLIVGNRFEGCAIGIHFTAGSEKNALTGNAFIANRTQVKYVGSRDVEWSFEGKGNFWSDHPVFDLNDDGIADSAFRPNDLMDHILWSQPAAALLLGAPAVQLIRWSQANFPATLPGGVVDSFPLTRPGLIAVPENIAAMVAASHPIWRDKSIDDEPDALTSH